MLPSSRVQRTAFLSTGQTAGLIGCLLAGLIGAAPSPARAQQGAPIAQDVAGSATGDVAGSVTGTDLLRRAGSRASVVLLIDPAQWRRAQAERDAIASWWPEAADDGGTGAILVRQLKRPDPLPLLLAVMAIPSPDRIVGVDVARPLVFVGAEAEHVSLGEVGKTFLADKVAPFVPVTRQRLLIPATDAAALAAALTASLTQSGYVAVKGHPRVVRSAERAVAIFAEPDLVRIEVARTSEAAAAANAARWLGAAEQSIDTGVTGATGASAAFQFAAQAGGWINVHVRPRLLRDFLMNNQAVKINAAIQGVDPEMRVVLAIQAVSEMASADLLLLPDRAEADDFAVSLGAGRLDLVLSLTERGRDAWKAGFKGARLPAFTAAPWLARARLPISLDAAMGKGAPNPFFDTPKALMEAMRECGTMCGMALLVQPLEMARLMIQAIAPGRRLPDGLALSLLAATEGGGFGVAAAIGAGIDAKKWAAGWLEGAENVTLKVQPNGGTKVVTMGFKLDPDKAFAKGPATVLPAGTVADVEVSGELGAGNAELAKIVPATLRARARIAVQGAALVGQLYLEERSAEPRRFALPALAGAPAQSPSIDSGAFCLLQATARVRRAFGAVASVDPTMRATLLRAGAAEGKLALECALRDPATKADAGALQELEQMALREVVRQEPKGEPPAAR